MICKKYLLKNYPKQISTMDDTEDFLERSDSILPSLFANAYTGQGTSRDRSQFTQIQRRRKLAQQEIDSLYEFHWMVQNLVDVLPDECTRKWIDYKINGEENAPKLIENFIKYQDRLVDDIGDEVSTADIFNEALKDERLTGGAIVYIDIEDGKQPWEPVDEQNIKTINFLSEFDRWAVTPEYRPDLEKDTNFTSSFTSNSIAWDLSKPTHYRLNLDRGSPAKMGLLHRTRVLRFGGPTKLSYRARQRNQGWGNSVLEAFYQPLTRYETAASLVSALLPEIIKKTWKIKGLWDKIVRGKQKEIQNRLAEAALIESSFRYRAIDMDQEDIMESSLNLEGIFGAFDKAIEECVAASNLPRTYLLGVSPPGGLKAGGENEQTDMNKTVEQYQSRHISRPLNRFLNLCWLAKDSPTKGKIPEGFSWEFVNPFPMTEKQKSELFSTYAGAFSSYINSQVLLPEEVAKSVFGGAVPQYQIALDVEKRKRIEEEQNAPAEQLGEEELTGFEEEN